MNHSRLLSGAAWTYAGVAVSGVLQIAASAITARLVDPAAFGILALANVALRFGRFFSLMGVGRALVQRSELTPAHRSAGLALSVVFGATFTLAGIGLAPAIGEAFGVHEVSRVLQLLSLTFLLNGLAAVPRAELERQLQFGVLAAIEVTSYAIGYALPTVLLALHGYGVWSLVAGVLGQSLLTLAASWAVGMPKSLEPPARRHYRDLLGFGSGVSTISFLEFLTTNVDTLLLGRFATPALLGIYNRALMLPNLVLYRLHFGVGRVLQPVLAREQGDLSAFNQTLARSIDLFTRIVIPTAVGISIASNNLVYVVLGARWAQAAPAMAVLAMGLAANLLASFPAAALEATAHLGPKFRVQILSLVGIGAGATLVLRLFGPSLVAIAGAVSTGYVLRSIWMVALCARYELLRREQAWGLLRQTVRAGAITGSLIGAASIAVDGVMPSRVESLGVSVIMGCAALLAINWSLLADVRMYLRRAKG